LEFINTVESYRFDMYGTYTGVDLLQYCSIRYASDQCVVPFGILVAKCLQYQPVKKGESFLRYNFVWAFCTLYIAFC
jgi:hypothetical protein